MKNGDVEIFLDTGWLWNLHYTMKVGFIGVKDLLILILEFLLSL